jgi:flavorubredoxin
MPKILILYDSQTGNTEKMAEAVSEGATSVPNVEVVLKYYARPEELVEVSAIIFGSPTYYHNITLPIKQIMEEAARANVQFKDKIGAAFGSYGWSGEAPELILEILESRFGMKIVSPGLALLYTPDEAGLEKCRKLGRMVAEKIVGK